MASRDFALLSCRLANPGLRSRLDSFFALYRSPAVNFIDRSGMVVCLGEGFLHPQKAREAQGARVSNHALLHQNQSGSIKKPDTSISNALGDYGFLVALSTKRPDG